MRTGLNFLCTALCISMLFGCSSGVDKRVPTDYVYMYIGTINPKTRGTTPVIKVPGGTVSLFPTFSPMTDWYFADKIHGFPLGVGSLMANTGQMKVGVRENASRFDHDFETATPYYYQVLLEDPDIDTEFTITSNTILFRFTLPEHETSNLFVNLSGSSLVEIKGETVIEGETMMRGGGRGAGRSFFHAVLSKPFAECGTWRNDTIFAGSKAQSGSGAGFYVSYPVGSRKETVEFRIGISRNSMEEARDFLAAEAGAKSFDQVKAHAKRLWDDDMSVITVKGGTEKQRELFYTTLHRTRALRMGNVWDTYRSAYPLQALIKPEEIQSTIRGWLDRYDNTGWLISSGAMIGHHATAVITDAYLRGLRDFDVEKAYEAMRKNHTQATMIPWRDDMYITELEQCYFDNGFFPSLPVRAGFNTERQEWVPHYWSPDVSALNTPMSIYDRLPYQSQWLANPHVEEWVEEVHPWHRRQSVAVTLEHAYDDWCLAQMAKELGKEDDYRLFMQRAHNYQNLWNAETGFMSPKSADGNWIVPFDPMYSGGFAGEHYFAETNAYIYSWHVQHDVQGLINLMGGDEKFISRLNELFVTNHRNDKLQFLAQFPDMTGLMGMYCHGNEPSWHIPFFYNYAGQPWMTQNKVRQMMELWFDTTPFGLSGDEDGGSMSSWYVLNAIGLYPQCPGRPVWDIGSPLFEETTIDVGGGKKFVIEAKDVSNQNKYIQSATLNGKTHNQAWINHSDIVQGGRLVFQMGPRPNKSWGAAPEARPPSMSTPTR